MDPRKILYLSPSARFEDDPNPGGGATGDPADKKTDPEPKPKPPEKYTIKVDGQDMDLTLEELKQKAEEAGGAQKRFQEAAEIRKKFGDLDAEAARAGARIVELTQKLQSTGELSGKETEELYTLMGVDPSAMGGADDDQKGGRKKDATPPAPKKVALDDLPDEVKEAVAAYKEASFADAKGKIDETVKIALDKDKELAKMVADTPEASRKEVQEALLEMALSDVWARIGAGQEFGPPLLQTVAQGLRARVRKLGVPGDPQNLPVSQLVSDFGPVLGPQISQSEPIKRGKIGDDSYIETAAARLGQMIERARARAIGRA